MSEESRTRGRPAGGVATAIVAALWLAASGCSSGPSLYRTDRVRVTAVDVAGASWRVVIEVDTQTVAWAYLRACPERAPVADSIALCVEQHTLSGGGPARRILEFENDQERRVFLVDARGRARARELLAGEHDVSRSIRDVAEAVESQVRDGSSGEESDSEEAGESRGPVGSRGQGGDS